METHSSPIIYSLTFPTLEQEIQHFLLSTYEPQLLTHDNHATLRIPISEQLY